MLIRLVWVLLCSGLVAGGQQLDPSLVPHKAPKPALPFVQKKACPFEGCQFGKWTATQPVKLYADWKDSGSKRVVAVITAHEVVTAVTGIYITYEPAEIKVTAPIPAYGLKPGDTVYTYMSLGEGTFNAWFNGFYVEQFDGSGIQERDGLGGCSRNCNAILLKEARADWWVQIRTKKGTVGWTRMADRFAGKDALAGLPSLFLGRVGVPGY